MRINVYSQELTFEVLEISKASNTGIVYQAVQFVLHSSPMLHHPPEDDDRSAVTFWLPRSVRGLKDFKQALNTAGALVEAELIKAERQESISTSQDERFRRTYERNHPISEAEAFPGSVLPKAGNP